MLINSKIHKKVKESKKNVHQTIVKLFYLYY